jgi:glycosyltransferase involved in cell wall biosynthesis
MFNMKFLIVSTHHRLTSYRQFVLALESLGEEAILADAGKYIFLSESRPLHVIPSPRLLNLTNEFNPDVILTDYPNYIAQIAKLFHKPIMYHLGGAEQGKLQYLDAAMYPSLLARAYTLYLTKITALSIKKIDYILPNCKWLQGQINEIFPNHPNSVLYEGIDPNEVLSQGKLSIDIKHPSVVSIFQLGIYGKVEGLLKFINVVNRMPDVNFYIAGSGPYLHLVKKHCPSNMFLLGQLPKSETFGLLKNCDVFVHPSSLDALPRSVKEASILEKPIVASTVGGIPEIVINNETGYLCDIDDVELWIEKIRYLFDNPDVATNFGRKARKHVEYTFNWERIAGDFLKQIKTWNI